MASGTLVTERGYTSHEHLAEVGLIHMNGRLYDPSLRRFLNADENIQDPYNTQNYNKYGYVLNNPLMYGDPSGEFFVLFGLGVLFWKAVIIGAAIGLASYTVGLAVTGKLYQWSVGGALKSIFWGAVSGAVTFGIGNIFSVAKDGVQVATAFAKSLGEVGTVFVQAGAHAVAQGALSLMQGGNFGQAFLSGALGSLGASAFGALAGNVANKAIGQIAFGALSGGIGAELTGGNFWQGAVIGGMVAGLNHTMHKLSVIKTLSQEMIENGLNPDDCNVSGRSGELIKKVPSISKIANAITSKGGTVVITDTTLGTAAGYTDLNSYEINMNINAMKNNTLLGYAYTLGHELIHAFDLQFNTANWSSAMGSRWEKIKIMNAYREIRAYNWEISKGYQMSPYQQKAYNSFNSVLSSPLFLQNKPYFQTQNPW